MLNKIQYLRKLAPIGMPTLAQILAASASKAARDAYIQGTNAYRGYFSAVIDDDGNPISTGGWNGWMQPNINHYTPTNTSSLSSIQLTRTPPPAPVVNMPISSSTSNTTISLADRIAANNIALQILQIPTSKLDTKNLMQSYGQLIVNGFSSDTLQALKIEYVNISDQANVIYDRDPAGSIIITKI
jgi:hypothetical protein